MSQQIAKSTTESNGTDFNTANPSWSNGWYLFEDGKVIGPLQANEAFHRPEKTPSGQSRMVSRKGFTQWYPLRDFAELHSMAGKYADQLALAKRAASPINQAFAQHEPIAKTLGPDHRQAVSTPSDSIARIQIASQDILNSKAAPVKSNLTRHQRKQLQKEERRKQQASAKKTMSVSTKMPLPTAERQRVSAFEDQYLLVASRLRLGRQRSPFVSGFIYTPLTLGGYWGSWVDRVSEELTWHLSGSSRVNFVLPMWMALIPGVHLYFAWMLARLLSEVEMQNGYRTISPAFAVFLALIPPFYMLSIQSAMNRHWRLHVYHSMDRQMLAQRRNS